MKPLSPSAQAVLDACDQAFDQCGTTAQGLAAALRAVADQVVPAGPWVDDCCITQCEQICAELLAIAAELEAQP